MYAKDAPNPFYYGVVILIMPYLGQGGIMGGHVASPKWMSAAILSEAMTMSKTQDKNF